MDDCALGKLYFGDKEYTVRFYDKLLKSELDYEVMVGYNERHERFAGFLSYKIIEKQETAEKKRILYVPCLHAEGMLQQNSIELLKEAFKLANRNSIHEIKIKVPTARRTELLNLFNSYIFVGLHPVFNCKSSEENCEVNLQRGILYFVRV
jgi:hypothetical protein